MWTNSLKNEYAKSIKGVDTEEKFDLLFYRPLGFLLAKISHKLHLTPTHLSLLGLITGVGGGVLYAWPDKTSFFIIATFCFILSGIFDSADGQLARIAKQSTHFGLILDGICDNIVFMTIYLASLYHFIPEYGGIIYLFGVIAGICHSFQSSILDFHNREYLYFGYGKDSYWNPNLAEAKENIEKETDKKSQFFLKSRYSWLCQQHFLSVRTSGQRKIMQDFLLQGSSSQKKDFMRQYRKYNKTILRFWRIMGSNFHTIMIITFNLFQRFDLYIFLIDIFFINFALLIMRFFQKKQDQKFFNALHINETHILNESNYIKTTL